MFWEIFNASLTGVRQAGVAIFWTQSIVKVASHKIAEDTEQDCARRVFGSPAIVVGNTFPISVKNADGLRTACLARYFCPPASESAPRIISRNSPLIFRG
jgi:hypothetical protein